MPNPTATCERCGRVVDLAHPLLTIVPVVRGGYTFCPGCDEVIPLDAGTTRRARAARGEPPGGSNPGG